jgi:subtilisin family serine protease
MASFLSFGVGVLNLSIGCYTGDGKAPFVLERAVDVLSRQGIVLVASAGNHGENNATAKIPDNAPIFPAACAGAVAVGAIWSENSQYFRASFSPDAQWVNLVAPGVNVNSTYLKGKVQIYQLPGLAPPPATLVDFPGFAIWSGTSVSAAAVSGEIARLMAPGGMTPRQALDELLARKPSSANGAIGRYEQGMLTKP